MMKEQICEAHAKINLGLDVVRRREDGYHDLRMIMQSLDLSDRVLLRKKEEKGIGGSVRFLPDQYLSERHGNEEQTALLMDEHNLAWKAAALLMDEFSIPGGLEIHLEKQIPMAAGLAGGSADAAAVLRGCNDLFDLGLSDAELRNRGVRLGADVPYCLFGGTALAEGIGERLTRLPSPPDCSVLLVKPRVSVSTAYVYGHLVLNEKTVHPDIDRQIRALREGSLADLSGYMDNLLEAVTEEICPEVAAIRGRILALGALGARMSGSGPTVFGLFPEKETACRAGAVMRKEYPHTDIILTSFQKLGGE